MLSDLIKNVSEYHDTNLNYYNKFSYLLTFLDKVPLDEFSSCNPLIPSKQEHRQHLTINESIYTIHPAHGNTTDTFLMAFFTQFNTAFSSIDFLVRFREFKLAFFKDLKYSLPKKDRSKLSESCDKMYINNSILTYIAKYYNISIIISNDKTYGDSKEHQLYLTQIDKIYHRLSKLNQD